jgi:hypothetical protein
MARGDFNLAHDVSSGGGQLPLELSPQVLRDRVRPGPSPRTMFWSSPGPARVSRSWWGAREGVSSTSTAGWQAAQEGREQSTTTWATGTDLFELDTSRCSEMKPGAST